MPCPYFCVGWISFDSVIWREPLPLRYIETGRTKTARAASEKHALCFTCLVSRIKPSLPGNPYDE